MGLFSSLLRVTVMVPLPAWPSAGFNVESFPQLGTAPSGLVTFLSLYPGLTPRASTCRSSGACRWPCCLSVGYLSEAWDSRPYLGDNFFVSIRGSRLLGWVPPLRGLCGFLSLYPGLTPRAITCRSSGACRWPCCLSVGYLSDGWDSRPYLGDNSFVSIRVHSRFKNNLKLKT